MRILIDGRTLSESQYSGVSWYTHHLLSAMLSFFDQHRFDIFYSGKRHHADSLRAQFPKARIIHAKMPNKLLNGLFAASSMFGLDHFFGGKRPDIVFMPNMNFIRMKSDIPLVVTVHDLSYVHFPHFFSWKQRLWHSLVRPKALLNRAHTIIAVSGQTAADIADTYFVESKKINVISHGIEPRFKKSNPDAYGRGVLKRFGIRTDFLLFVGAFEPRKNIDGIVSAYRFAKKRGLSLDLVMVGPKGWKNHAFHELISKTSSIHHLGYVAPDILDMLYEECVGVVSPSIFEGFGFPAKEASRHGKPVIASHAGAMLEKMPFETLFVDPYNIADIAGAMMQIHGQKISVPSYASWKDVASQTLDVFASAVASNRLKTEKSVGHNEKNNQKGI